MVKHTYIDFCVNYSKHRWTYILLNLLAMCFINYKNSFRFIHFCTIIRISIIHISSLVKTLFTFILPQAYKELLSFLFEILFRSIIHTFLQIYQNYYIYTNHYIFSFKFNLNKTYIDFLKFLFNIEIEYFLYLIIEEQNYVKINLTI